MRYKEFNKNRVLEKCILLFWNKGFGGCSVKQIVETTGVNRFSLYNEFENKEGILYASLNLYNQRYLNKKLVTDYKKNNLSDELLAFFSHFLLDENEHPPGCYIIHIATELADHDEKVKMILDRYTQELDNKFFVTLERFQAENPMNRFYAKHLVVLFCSSMCHCVIQSKEQRISHIQTSIHILLNKKSEYATHA
jgi:AcrR family transcriptional regulator